MEMINALLGLSTAALNLAAAAIGTRVAVRAIKRRRSTPSDRKG